ncbi:3-deoxy-D-manno-octulosonic acid transferase [Flavobacterium sp. CYK-4]|uniref:3-deoxy-D-manno-octulosonic acid transferase n=1 Tax=Flavobacterium lotistagni TaxID=2709660 RepID=UPI001408464D|nr:glycosyltransferase N-terminal domain-containing protein [Flavobacterium lotistagni]NHM08286.1 3-deoxy-D-manno-octulosonic acid transferase [Flavobacterium lotistagni]
MFFWYQLIVAFAGFVVKVLAVFSPKMKLFYEGRKVVFSTLRDKIHAGDKTIWFHAASLGEYEQGLPVMEQIKQMYPNHKIVLTFFSPSGYEIRKNNTVADVTVYLPLDSRSNAIRFIEIVQPELVFFIKYEYWPNYLKVLQEKSIRTFLISGIFRKDQAFFKWYGGFYKNALQGFEHFFVQNSGSKDLLLSLGKTNVTVSGDTRFDRVATILQKDNHLDFISEFKNDALTIVVGSSWPKDESLLVNFINTSNLPVKLIIAPHNIKEEQIGNLRKSITKKTVLYSEKENKTLADFEVFIIDTIGILTKIYSEADIAYVGGGFGNPGVHNILEPATFGVPILIGPNYSHFAEATALVNMGGCVSISDASELQTTLEKLILDVTIRAEKGHICSTFVQMNTGATASILNYIQQNKN